MLGSVDRSRIRIGGAPGANSHSAAGAIAAAVGKSSPPVAHGALDGSIWKGGVSPIGAASSQLLFQAE
jgi:hypothetical protein